MTAIGEIVISERITNPPKSMVGRRVRRVDNRTGIRSPWAIIENLAPSPDGYCWLVTLWDEQVDVWRIDAPDVTYEFPN